MTYVRASKSLDWLTTRPRPESWSRILSPRGEGKSRRAEHALSRIGVLHQYRDALPAAGAGRGDAVAAVQRCSSRATVSVQRTPVAPSGWPMAMAPPLTLTLARSSPNSRSTAMYCAPNASLISKRAMSSQLQPGLGQHRADGGRGPDPHDLRRHAYSGPGDDAGQRLAAILLAVAPPRRPPRHRRWPSCCRPSARL